MKRPFMRKLIPVLLLFMVFGCRSITPAVNHYVLNSMAAGDGPPVTMEEPGPRIVAVGPVRLPSYVNRLQMVMRNGSSELEISEFHRWADYPDRLVQQVLEDNLQVLLPRDQVVGHPLPAGLKPDVTVAVRFGELIGTAEKKMRLRAMWTLRSEGEPATERSWQTRISEPISGTGFMALAAAHSRVLEMLCREIAQALNGSK
ncbi:lipoprotein [Desulfosarcina widdelii]|uniref:Lipoprotein n=1 Tax=Desulfosarcina widdelii TaxID=947919 RepID=A0A5K7Z0F9_9BACT|nr:PqiC family protein [Desulfosarcina widdelii]BBO74175.1 lipoprotein [Desulfosarcina widdelii]